MHQRAELLMSDGQDFAFSMKQIILKITLNSNRKLPLPVLNPSHVKQPSGSDHSRGVVVLIGEVDHLFQT